MFLIKFYQFLLMLLFHFDDFGPLSFVLNFVFVTEGKIWIRGTISKRLFHDGLNGGRSWLFGEMIEIVFYVFKQFFIRLQSILHKLDVCEEGGWGVQIHVSFKRL